MHEKMDEDGEEAERKDGNTDEFMCKPCGVEEAERQRTVRTPSKPRLQEVEDHELTHCPFRSWCEHCVRGQAKDDRHPTVREDFADSSVVRVVIDYCFLQEDVTEKKTEHEEKTVARTSMTILVMLETLCHSIWAYAVEAKGAMEELLTNK